METNPIKVKVGDERVDLYRDEEVCDFCGSSDVQYTAYVTKGSVIHAGDSTVSDDDWAVCPICAALIEEVARLGEKGELAASASVAAALTRRSINTFPPERAPTDGLTRILLKLHAQFWNVFERMEKNS